MARFTFSSPDGDQVDPFNAGDPVMPGGEPEPLDGDDPLEAPYAPHGEPGGEPHKDDDNYQAPTTRPRDYDAPSTDAPPASGTAGSAARDIGRQWQRALSKARGKRGGGPRPGGGRTEGAARRGTALRAIVILVFVASLLWSLMPLLASCVGSLVNDVFLSEPEPDHTYSWSDVKDHANETEKDAQVEPDAQAAADALDEALGAALSTPESGALHDQLASYFEGKLLDLDGRRASELGLDADAWASWVIRNTSYSVETAYVYGDGTASVYASILAPDANSFVWDLWDAYAYHLRDEGVDDGDPLTDGQRAYVADAYADLLGDYESDAEGDAMLWNFDAALVDDAWVVDAESLPAEFEIIYSLF